MKKNAKKYILAAILCLIALGIGFGIGYFLLPPKEPISPQTDSAPGSTEEQKNPLTEANTKEEKETEEEKKTVNVSPLMKGIDVSKWQGKPNWKKIAASGVEFAMIRIGFHGTSGPLGEDPCADYNLKSAAENGILTGVYFYSLAKDTEEAEQEAEWVLERVGNYAISLPIVIDYEMMDNDAAVSAKDRTEIALAFLRKVQKASYTGMLYVPVKELNDEKLWEKDRILEEFKVWVADYNTPVTEAMQHPDGVTDYAMWQYSNTGRVDGISGNVDLNFAYFTAERVEPKNP